MKTLMLLLVAVSVAPQAHAASEEADRNGGRSRHTDLNGEFAHAWAHFSADSKQDDVTLDVSHVFNQGC